MAETDMGKINRKEKVSIVKAAGVQKMTESKHITLFQVTIYA
jgi:hypothetical protein